MNPMREQMVCPLWLGVGDHVPSISDCGECQPIIHFDETPCLTCTAFYTSSAMEQNSVGELAGRGILCNACRVAAVHVLFHFASHVH